MGQPLHRLVYCSRGKIADEDRIDEIHRILDVARMHNSRNKVTGILTFSGNYFAQVLEGARDAVDLTYAHIQADVRHDDVTLLSFDPVLEHTFGTWPLAFCLGVDGAQRLANPIFENAIVTRSPESNEQVINLLRDWQKRFHIW